MSYVTNVILTWNAAEPEEDKLFLDKVNKCFTLEVGRDNIAAYNQRGFVCVDDPTLPSGWYGGSKYLECGMAIGAFNYLSLERLVIHIENVEREINKGRDNRDPIIHEIQLLVKDQNDSKFSIIDIGPFLG